MSNTVHLDQILCKQILQNDVKGYYFIVNM